MCALSVIFTFVLAHIVAWSALGSGWSGAARAPFVVFIPALALLLLDAVLNDAFQSLPHLFWTLVSAELLYFFGYLCLRVTWRPAPAGSRR